MDEATARNHLVCPACRRGPLEIRPFEAHDGAVSNGVLFCGPCREWYRIENGLPVLLLPALRDPERDRGFRDRFRKHWDGWDSARGVGSAAGPGDAAKLESIAFFRDAAKSYDRGITDSPFWNAFDASFLDAVRRSARGRGILVEAGGGTGRLALPLSRDFGTVLCFDLSEEMAARARDRFAGRPNAHAFVADAENIPLKPGTADCVVFSGVLTYLDSPGTAIAETARILADDGVMLGQENNLSLLRPLFNLLKKSMKCWTAKSYPEDAALSLAGLEEWLAAAGLDSSVWTEIFLPPHVFSLLPSRWTDGVLRLTNSLGRRAPILSRHGGLLLFSAVKGIASGKAVQPRSSAKGTLRG